MMKEDMESRIHYYMSKYEWNSINSNRYQGEEKLRAINLVASKTYQRDSVLVLLIKWEKMSGKPIIVDSVVNGKGGIDKVKHLDNSLIRESCKALNSAGKSFRSIRVHGIQTHKILVIETDIFRMGTVLKSIPYFRLVIKGQWVDVVALDHFEKYLKKLTKRYDDYAS
jgi:hypothetical protein